MSKEINSPLWITPIWPAPKTIIAGTTITNRTITGVTLADQIITDSAITGKNLQENLSNLAKQDFNLATHTGRCKQAAYKNRQLLTNKIAESTDIHKDKIATQWLTQTHSAIATPFKPTTTHVTAIEYSPNAKTDQTKQQVEADAIFSNKPFELCSVLTADCLPILLCSHDGEHIAAVHAGWRGLAAGVINNTVSALNYLGTPSNKLYAWLGPAIGPQHFEVGEEVKQAFMEASIFLGNPTLIDNCFIEKRKKNLDEYAYEIKNKTLDERKCFANLYQLGTLALKQAGLHHIYGGGFNTFSDQRFYSHRQASQQYTDTECKNRENQNTGRMASFILRLQT